MMNKYLVVTLCFLSSLLYAVEDDDNIPIKSYTSGVIESIDLRAFEDVGVSVAFENLGGCYIDLKISLSSSLKSAVKSNIFTIQFSIIDDKNDDFISAVKISHSENITFKNKQDYSFRLSMYSKYDINGLVGGTIYMYVLPQCLDTKK